MITYPHIFIAIIYLVLDVLWIYSTASLLYTGVFTRIQNKTIKPKLLPAIIAYVLLVCALWFLCVPLYKYYKLTISNDIYCVLLSFGLTGFFIYGVFNTTNATIFTDYPNSLMLYDTLWGTFIFTVIGLLYKQFQYDIT